MANEGPHSDMLIMASRRTTEPMSQSDLMRQIYPGATDAWIGYALRRWEVIQTASVDRGTETIALSLAPRRSDRVTITIRERCEGASGKLAKIEAAIRNEVSNG